MTPLYKALSTDFHRSIDFYAARDAKFGEDTLKSFGVEKVPALLFLDGDKVTRYEGQLKDSAQKSDRSLISHISFAGALKYDALHAFFKPLASRGGKSKDEL